jgi:adenylosuccinate lyase
MAAHPIDYRYGSKPMRKIWDEQSRFEYYLLVEAALARALAKQGKIPKEAAKEITAKATAEHVKLSRMREIEGQTHHDVMATVLALSEQCGQWAKYVHYTATSNDIVDTAQALQLQESLQLLVEKSRGVLLTLLKLSKQHTGLVMVGRTHGQHALPITLGFKFANYADKIGRDATNLQWDALYSVEGKFSGAVGTYSAQNLAGIRGTDLENAIYLELGAKIKPALISTQVVGREGIARIVSDVAVLAGTLEQIAKEVRNLQRTEIGELAEPYGDKQVGSSTMAHKKNPIDCENVCSNARVVRSCVGVALENIALEHERDLTNSASERSILPTAFLLTDDMLDRMQGVLGCLVVNPQAIWRNLQITGGAMMSEAVITALVQKGVGRQEAHELVRKVSQRALSEGKPLKEAIQTSTDFSGKFTKKELDGLFDYPAYIGAAAQKVDAVNAKWSAFAKEDPVG